MFYAGRLCGLHRFDADRGLGYLHVLRRGELEVTHPRATALPKRIRLSEPSVLFYPRPILHSFHNPPVEGADFVCATLDFDGGANNPIARALPPLIAIPLAAIHGLESSLNLLFEEADSVKCGRRLLADKIFEVVLIQLLRWCLDNPETVGTRPGLIGGLSDPRLARALVAMHEQPGDAWTLESLGRLAGMSRSAFANRFREIVGRTPLEYLTDWRLTLAQTRLREGQPIKMLANDLGYANASALSRVFSSRIGVSPREWLSQNRTPPSSRGDS